ncbi:MAG: hypothetical protein IJE07_01600 [Clostridia bacterium]|nr:hypothetical protein [Clostridia bacterium]
MKAEMTQWIQSRIDHVLTLERDHSCVTAAALAQSATKRWSTPGKAWSTLGLNVYDPVPQELMNGNFRRGRILRRQPQDMRDKWEYDLNEDGTVLWARLHCSEWLPRWGYEDNLLVPSVAGNELTYLNYSLREGLAPWSDYFLVYRFDAQGRLECRLQGAFHEGMRPTAEVQTFLWEGDRLLRVHEHISPSEEPSWEDIAALRILINTQ